MIIKGNQRGWGKRLALHLTNDQDNDHIEYEIRDLAAQDVMGAFLEIEATARGTRCKEPFYSCSFNPPEGVSVSQDQFESAFEAVEKKLKLDGQPRVIFYHEKEGRRHAHVVWSRIDTERQRAIQLSYDRDKLQAVSKQLYRDLGLEAPAGFRDKNDRSPLNYDRPVWLQARRLAEDPRDLKRILRECLLQSAGREGFERALAPHALYLARGDQRGFCVVHHSGEILSMTKYSGLNSRQIAERIGPPDGLPPASRVQAHIRSQHTEPVKRRLAEAKTRQAEQLRALREQIRALKERQWKERIALGNRQHERFKREERARANRLRKGVAGLWERVSGKRGKVSEVNAREKAEHKARDRQEKQGLIDRHLEQRQALQVQMAALRERQKTERRQLRAELATLLRPLGREAARGSAREAFRDRVAPEPAPPGRGEPGYAEWRQAQREITRDRRERGESGRDGRGRERGGEDGRGRERGGRAGEGGRDVTRD